MAKKLLTIYLVIACAAGVRVMVHNGAVLANHGQLIRELPVLLFVGFSWTLISFVAMWVFMVCNMRGLALSAGLYFVYAVTMMGFAFAHALWAVKNHIHTVPMYPVPIVAFCLLLGLAYFVFNVHQLVRLCTMRDVGSKLGIAVGMPDSRTYHRLGPTESWGPVVHSIDAKGLAHKAGIQKADMILEVDGIAASSMKGDALDLGDAVSSYFQNCAAGHTLRLLIRRDSAEQLVVLQL